MFKCILSARNKPQWQRHAQTKMTAIARDFPSKWNMNQRGVAMPNKLNLKPGKEGHYKPLEQRNHETEFLVSVKERLEL